MPAIRLMCSIWMVAQELRHPECGLRDDERGSPRRLLHGWHSHCECPRHPRYRCGPDHRIAQHRRRRDRQSGQRTPAAPAELASCRATRPPHPNPCKRSPSPDRSACSCSARSDGSVAASGRGTPDPRERRCCWDRRRKRLRSSIRTDNASACASRFFCQSSRSQVRSRDTAGSGDRLRVRKTS